MDNVDINMKSSKVENKDVLIGKDISELEDWAIENGESKFRGSQIFEWIYKHIENDPLKMSNISEQFRRVIFNKKEKIFI